MANIDVTRGRAREDGVIEHTGFRLSWGAIFAGLAVATVLQVALSLLGIGLGFLGWNAGDPLASLGLGAAIWAALTAIATLFIGGMTTGRLAGVLTRGDGALHGVVMWALSSLLGMYLLWSVLSFLVGGALGIVGSTVSTAAGAVTSGVVQAGAAAVGQMAGLDAGALQREFEAILRETGNPALRPDSLSEQIQDAGESAVSGQNNQALAADVVAEIQRTAGQVRREDLINIISARTELSRPEADRLAARIETAVASARSQISTTADTLGARAGAVAQDVEGALARVAWIALLIMGLSVGAAAWGTAITARE